MRTERIGTRQPTKIPLSDQLIHLSANHWSRTLAEFESKLTYRDAGVDINAGDNFVEAIKPIARSTDREGCVSGLGGFGALFEIPKSYRRPVLVAATDGVGTKLKLAFRHGRHNTVGIDLVAMSANDVVVQGAEPLFFLDYFATGRLQPEVAHQVVAGIGEGCRAAGAALIGGETAEMPGMYIKGEYDLAGFCVGAVEHGRILDGRAVSAGDALVGLASSGPHANGFSLIRKIIDDGNIDLSQRLGADSLLDLLLAPTRIYVKPLLALLRRIDVHALAHITGGGVPGNLCRVLPPGCRAVVDTGNWSWPPIFNWLQQTARIETDEMYRTFNCGLGMIAVIGESDTDAAMELLRDQGETPILIGHVEAAGSEPEVVVRHPGAQP